MPGTRCTVAVCTNSFQKTKRAGIKVKYHKFPKNQPVRNIWIERCGRAGRWNPDSCHVCSIHFTNEDYIVQDELTLRPGKKNLRPTAVPSLFLTEPPPLSPPLMTPRKRIKISLNDQTTNYSNKDNIMYSQHDASDYTDLLNDQFEDSENDQTFSSAMSKTDDLARIDLQAHRVNKRRKDKGFELQDESHYSSRKHYIVMRNIATQTEFDYFIPNNFQSLLDENSKLKNELTKLNMQHEKLLSSLKFLESEVQNLNLSKIV